MFTDQKFESCRWMSHSRYTCKHVHNAFVQEHVVTFFWSEAIIYVDFKTRFKQYNNDYILQCRERKIYI